MSYNLHLVLTPVEPDGRTKASTWVTYFALQVLMNPEHATALIAVMQTEDPTARLSQLAALFNEWATPKPPFSHAKRGQS